MSDKTQNALFAAYVTLLRLPIGHPLRIRTQHVLAGCVNALSDAMGVSCEALQESCESEAALQNKLDGMADPYADASHLNIY